MAIEITASFKLRGGHVIIAKVYTERADTAIGEGKQVIDAFTAKPMTLEPGQTLHVKVTE